MGEEFNPQTPQPTDRAAWVDFAMENNYRLPQRDSLRKLPGKPPPRHEWGMRQP